MRKIRICAIITVVMVMLSSCSASVKENPAREIRELFSEYEKITAKCEITADYGEKIYIFGVKYEGTADEGRIEVLSPENIAGISAKVSLGDEISLSYDTVTLDTGALAPDGLSPVSALPCMLSWWRDGYTSEVSYEKYKDTACAVLKTEVSENEVLRTWFDKETLLPVYAEISLYGYVVIACTFENISMN